METDCATVELLVTGHSKTAPATSNELQFLQNVPFAKCSTRLLQLFHRLAFRKQSDVSGHASVSAFSYFSFNLVIGWQLSIWICSKPYFSLLYNCQLLRFCLLAVSIVVEVFLRLLFPDIFPSRMFTVSSLRLIICPIHERRLF